MCILTKIITHRAICPKKSHIDSAKRTNSFGYHPPNLLFKTKRCTIKVMKLSCLKGENNMDMIAEILQTDKAASGKLEKADMESGELLERTVKEAQELKENALKEAEAYKTQKAKEVTERINNESEKITDAQNEKTAALDKIFEEKHTQWEKEIFDNIISPK